MNIAIDTNRYSDLSRMDSAVVAFLRTVDSISVPFVVLAELRAGFRDGSREADNETQLQLFLSLPNVSVIFADEQTTRLYADLYVHVKQSGTPIPTNDLWIASLALQHGLSLFTRDDHFQRIPQLLIV